MNKIQKALQKFGKSEKNILKKIISQIKSDNFSNLDIKKLKGYDNVFRARKGKIRIIFQIKDDKVKLISIGKRNENTYKF